MLFVSAVAVASWLLMGKEFSNIAYYDKDFQVCGNVEYLQKQCKLDLRIPDNEKNFPTLVWFHGGGLSRGKKYFPKNISYDKIAVAAVNYRLSGKGAACPDYIYDAAAAVAWVKKHIKEYGGDPELIFVAGHSAGGYLTAMLALADKYLGAFGCKPAEFAGFYPFSGQMTTHFRILKERRDKGIAVPDIVIDEYAPIAHASPNAPAITLIMGDSEVDWPARLEENLLLAARLKRVYKVENVRCIEIPTMGHSSMNPPGCAILDYNIRHAVNQRNKAKK